eukprot:2039885-Rhodomonas_salina.2
MVVRGARACEGAEDEAQGRLRPFAAGPQEAYVTPLTQCTASPGAVPVFFPPEPSQSRSSQLTPLQGLGEEGRRCGSLPASESESRRPRAGGAWEGSGSVVFDNVKP